MPLSTRPQSILTAEHDKMILAALRSFPTGCTAKELQVVTVLSVHTIRHRLCYLDRTGYVDLYPRHCRGVWFLPEFADGVWHDYEATRAARNELMLDAKNKKKCATDQAKRAAARKLREEGDDVEWHEQRIVRPACGAPPLHPAGPRCVWELAV